MTGVQTCALPIYKVQETTTATAGDGWTLDTAAKTVTVVINDNGEGALEVGSVSGVTITNSYKASDITVDPDSTQTTFGTKVVSGTGFNAKTFTFTLQEVDAAGNAVTNGESQTKTLSISAAGSQAIGFDDITYSEAGT